MILDNLFSNAIKYSKSNSTITIGLVNLPDSKVGLSFKDTGIGMALDQLQWVRQRFYRIESEGQIQNVSGNGLGLHIVSEFCVICGFEIDIQSSLGRGTDIFLKLKSLPK